MFDILFGSGIDAVGGMLDAAESIGVLERKGSWYWLAGEKLTNVSVYHLLAQFQPSSAHVCLVLEAQ